MEKELQGDIREYRDCYGEKGNIIRQKLERSFLKLNCGIYVYSPIIDKTFFYYTVLKPRNGQKREGTLGSSFRLVGK